MKKLAIISTHPIQYNAPLFRKIAESGLLTVKVFYTWSQVEKNDKYDPGFGKVVNWDIPLLEGYDYTFVNNTAKDPGSHHRRGIINPTLIKEVEEWEPAAILVYGWNYESHYRLMRYFKGSCKIFFRGDSTLLDERTAMHKWIRRMVLRHVYRYIDYAVYTGKNNYDYYRACGLSGEQLFFAAHCINEDIFLRNKEEDQQKANEMRSRLHILPEEIIFLFAGKLENKKDPLLLLEAFMNAPAQNVHLVFVGKGELEAELKQRAAGNNRIHFAGFRNQTEMPVVYRMCDVFVLPSKGPHETWGLSVNEAMVCGRPVIASNKAGCAADLIHDKENGFIFNAGNAKQLSGIISSLTGNKELLPSMGAASERIISLWSLHQSAKSIAEGIISRLNT